MINERKLVVKNGNLIVGVIIENGDVFTFKYDEAWMASSKSFDISPKFSKKIKTHIGIEIKNFLENLLPEHSIRKKIAEKEKADIKDIIRLLEITGRDSAGALQIYSEKELTEMEYDPSKEIKISIKELAFEIKKNGTGINFITSIGLKPSLSGAQDKIACRYDSQNQTVFFPTNGGATTHIIKPNSQAENKEYKSLEYSALNELVSMRLAKKILGDVPHVQLYESNDRDLFIVERYDRLIESGELKRIHQFDFCQYYGISSSNKYEVSDSGTRIGPIGIKGLFDSISKETEKPMDKDLFLNWVVYNYLIENTDSHLKNISMISTESGFKLAPFYDITSVGFYKYDGTYLFDNHFAFLIGGKSKMNDICDYHWIMLAKSLGFKDDVFLEKIAKISSQISTNLTIVHQEFSEEIHNSINKKRIEKILKFIGNSTKEKAYRCLINTKSKIVREKCISCDLKMNPKTVKVSVLGICPKCLMKI